MGSVIPKLSLDNFPPFQPKNYHAPVLKVNQFVFLNKEVTFHFDTKSNIQSVEKFGNKLQ